MTDEEFEHDVALRMADPSGDAVLVDDWIAVAAAVREHTPILSGPLGYAGFSMGSLFGLSIVADLPDVRAAVFALGGTLGDDRLGPRGPGARNARVLDGASRLGDREVLMLNMTRDEHFPILGAIEVFEAIPGPKRMGVWAGTHVGDQAGSDRAGERVLRAHAALRSGTRRGLSQPGRTITPVSLRVIPTPYGRAASEALRGEIARAKGASPLAPVTVVVPGNSVGVAVRRLLASGELGAVSSAGVGLIGVNFLTTYRLAELLAAPAWPRRAGGRSPRRSSRPPCGACSRTSPARCSGASRRTRPPKKRSLARTTSCPTSNDARARRARRSQSPRAERSFGSIAS